MLLARLHIRAATAGRRDFHAQNQIAVVERIMRQRIFPGALIKLGHAHARFLAFAQDYCGRLKRGENRGETGHDRADAGIAGEQTVVAVLAVARVAEVAIFLEANRVAVAEIPAARVLREVAANRGDVADLLRSDFGRGFVQAGKNFFDFRVVLDLRNGDERTNRPNFSAAFDFVQAGQRLDVDQNVWADEIFLEQAEQVVAAGEISALIGDKLAGAVGRVRGGVFKGFHALTGGGTFPRAARIFAGVMGRLETRTPIALATAFAIAPAVGTVAGSPMPMTPRSGMLIKTTSMSGTSAMPGSL